VTILFRRSDFCAARIRASSWKKHFGAQRFFRYVAAALTGHLDFNSDFKVIPAAGMDSPIRLAS
jgi:hypothetical protein